MFGGSVVARAAQRVAMVEIWSWPGLPLLWRGPWWQVWLLPSVALLMPLALWWWGRRPRATARLERYAPRRLWPYLLPPGALVARVPWLWFAAWGCVALALSGPWWARVNALGNEYRTLDIVLMVDISPSMRTRDVVPDRLTRAKHEAAEIMARLPDARFALLAFSAGAYPIVPLTPDSAAVKHFLDALDPALAIKKGSNLTRALQVAAGMLPQGGAVLMLSDGEAHDAPALRIADQLRAGGISVHAIGVGSAVGGPVPDDAGHFILEQDTVVHSRLEQAALEALTQAGGGGYVTARADDRDWQDLESSLQTAARALSMAQASGAYPLFPWFLAAGVVLFVWLGRGRAAIFAGMLCAIGLFAPPVTHAAPWTEQRALTSLQQGDWTRAASLYREIGGYIGALGAGVVEYRRGAYSAALRHFQEAQRRAVSADEHARAAYNTGNAWAQLQRYDSARQAYRTALRWQPEHRGAAYNLRRLAPAASPPLADLSGKTSGSSPNRSTSARDTPTGPGRALGRAGTATPPRQGAASAEAATALAAARALDTRLDATQEFLRNRFRVTDETSGVVLAPTKPW